MIAGKDGHPCLRAPFGPFGPVPHGHETLRAYSNLYGEEALVVAPASVDDLREVFGFARRAGRRVTLRGGGHAFDAQALGRDIVILLTAFDRIEVDRAEPTVTVGAGATWGAVLERLEPLGLVPYSTVTTRHATCGGTLASDCLSRFSPAYGKEAEHILRFELLTVDGQLVTCTPPGPTALEATWTLGERLFCSAIGGFGLLGAVLSITYELLRVGETNGKVGVATTLRKYRSYAHLASELVPGVRAIHERRRRGAIDAAAHPESVFSALFMVRGRRYALLFHSSYTTRPDRRPLAIHEPEAFFRILAEWALRSQWINVVTWPLFFALLFREGTTYVDDLPGFTFFMDGNRNAKVLGEQLGFAMRSIQQTFVVPAAHAGQDHGGDERGWDGAERRLVAFLELAHRTFEAVGLEPTLFDVLFLPRDERAAMSPSHDMDGFAVSFAFETSDPQRLDRIRACFVQLSDELDAIGGRVSLVKNVEARQITLARMYSRGLPRLRQLRREVDPAGVLRSDFVERNFPDLL